MFSLMCIFQFLFLKVPKRAVSEISFSESISTLENEGSYLRLMFFKIFSLLPFFLPCLETLSRVWDGRNSMPRIWRTTRVGGRAVFIYTWQVFSKWKVCRHMHWKCANHKSIARYRQRLDSGEWKTGSLPGRPGFGNSNFFIKHAFPSTKEK